MTKQDKKKKFILPVKGKDQKRVTIPKEIKTEYVEVQEHE